MQKLVHELHPTTVFLGDLVVFGGGFEFVPQVFHGKANA